MAPVSILTVFFMNPSHQLVSIFVCTPCYATGRYRHLVATNKSNNERIVRGVVFYTTPVVSKESTRLVLIRTRLTWLMIRLAAYMVPSVVARQRIISVYVSSLIFSSSLWALTEMSTRNLPGGKRAAGWRVRLTTPTPSVSRMSRKCGNRRRMKYIKI
jgi:hypothetical protein